MSQENIEVVRRALVDDGVDLVSMFRDDTAWVRRSAEIEELVQPDYTIAWIAQGQRPIEATGLDDVRQGWLDWLAPWETYYAQLERLIPVGRDTVLVLNRQHGRMAGTQREIEVITASVYLVRDGRVARIEHYASRAEALEAAGLRE